MNQANGRIYLGATSNAPRRRTSHVSHLNCGRHHVTALLRDWTQYNPDVFCFEELATVNLADVRQHEAEWIASLIALGANLYNSPEARARRAKTAGQGAEVAAE